MRRNGYINDLVTRGGSFTGANKPHGVVTVETDWFLNEESRVVGKYFNNLDEFHVQRRNPVRWFQRRDNSQSETVIPNVRHIKRDSSLGQDSSACEIEITNVKMKPNEAPRSAASIKGNELGDPGYYTFNRGERQPQRDRWHHSTNEWHRVLQPGAMLRTYEGYGGHDKSLSDCLVDGNLMQTGTWIVDDVSISHDGNLSLKCRDTASLLIDQLMYPELVPDACYPTQFYKNSETDYNYKDLSSIVVLICLWAGFWLKDSKYQPKIYGNVEQTGFVPDTPIGADFFDKRTCIDVINELKTLVGYITWVDQEGAFHFESPNYWEKGNFFYDGRHTDEALTLDENTNLMAYSVNVSKKSDRSDIYIASSNPQLNIAGAKFVHHTWPPGLPGEAHGTYLRGMCQPMMVPVKVDMPLNEMNIMSQLIHLYLWFSRRRGQATIPGNPCIDINDQVKINERNTAESFYHYVRGIRSDHDLVKGIWKMDLETNWLGTANDWAIVADGSWNIDYAQGDSVKVSPDAYGPYRNGKAVNRRASWPI